MPESTDVKVLVKVTNNLQTSRVLVIEPWLTEYAMPPGKSLEVIFTGNPKYSLEFEVDERGFVFFGFDSAGASMTVLDAGKPAVHLSPPS